MKRREISTTLDLSRKPALFAKYKFLDTSASALILTFDSPFFTILFLLLLLAGDADPHCAQDQMSDVYHRYS